MHGQRYYFFLFFVLNILEKKIEGIVVMPLGNALDFFHVICATKNTFFPHVPQ